MLYRRAWLPSPRIPSKRTRAPGTTKRGKKKRYGLVKVTETDVYPSRVNRLESIF
jgi:hypothetical protein